MIKIDLDTEVKSETKHVLHGCIELKGDIDIVSMEMYAIVKDFEENAPDAWFMAMDKRFNEVF